MIHYFKGIPGLTTEVALTLSFNFKDLLAARKENIYKRSQVFTKHVVAKQCKEWEEIIITKLDDSGNVVINMGVTTYYLSSFELHIFES